MTVNEVFRRFYQDYLKQYSPSGEQARVAKHIMNCRTKALGGHSTICEQCGYIAAYYNSCRDRHCPLCQGVAKAVWVDQRIKDTLDAPYFHVVFTIPSELHSLIYQNRRLLYNLMYKAVSGTLHELCQDEKHLGAQPGFFSILHTWGQDLHYHPHIHTVIMAGGLTKLNKWQSSSHKFFIPVRVLSKKFRGKFLHYLKEYYREGKLKFHGQAARLRHAFQALLDTCYSKAWYSYCQETFDGPRQVIQYLGRYTHRIAIANSRIISVDEKTVSFVVRDNKDQQKKKTCTLSGTEFIRRFLMHVLPKGFVKVRYYGVMACRNKKTKLKLCRKLTKSALYQPKYEGMTTLEVLNRLVGKDVTKCPKCKAELRSVPLRDSS